MDNFSSFIGNEAINICDIFRLFDLSMWQILLSVLSVLFCLFLVFQLI